MSVYNPTGSGNVHMDRSISGRKKVAPKKLPPALAKKAAGKADPNAQASNGKKENPFAKKAAKKAAPKKAY